MTTNPSGRSARRWVGWAFAGLLGLAGLVLVAGLWSGCRQYPAASSAEGVSCINLLYTACNTKDDKRLTDVERRAAELVADGKMTTAEKAGFDRVVGIARAGDWAGAEAAAFKMAQDQVGVGHPAPAEPKAKPTTRKK